MFKVVFYKDDNGNEPIKTFLTELQGKSKTSKADKIRYEKILQYIRILEEYGTRAGAPYMKHIEGAIWELRPLGDRIFFCHFDGKTFVLLHQFVKKSQKTPKKEIEQAKRNATTF